jgi:hypothetical protein
MFAELRQLLPRIIQRNKPFHVQTLVSQSPVETFDEPVLHRTARPNEAQLNVVAHHLSFQGPTAELTALVHRNAARQTSSLCSGSLQRLGYFHSGHSAIRFQTDALPRETGPPPLKCGPDAAIRVACNMGLRATDIEFKEIVGRGGLPGAQKRKKILLESLANVLELLGEFHHRDAKYLTNRH